MKLEVLDDAALRALGSERLIALAARVQRLIDTASAYQQRVIAVAEQRKAARAVGDISTADSLVRTTGISLRRARRVQRLAKTIAAHPEVAGALAAGAINTEQAEVIARADVSDTARARLLDTASTGESTDTTRLRAAATESAERSETPEERFIRQRSKRYLRFYNNRDGMVCMQGAMDPDTGARVKARITAIANRMWRQDKKQPAKHRRTPEQREIDALHDATTHPPTKTPSTPTNQNPAVSVDGGAGVSVGGGAGVSVGGGAGVSVGAVRSGERRRRHPVSLRPTSLTDSTDNATEMVSGDADSVSATGVGGYRQRARVLPVIRVSTSLQDLKQGLHRAGITESGEHLGVETIRRLACDAQIIPTVLGSKSRVIDVGRRTRVISEALRIAVIHRDKHCVWYGCDAAPARCDCHHVQHWADGGPTNLDNLALLCHRHHILLHEGHYKLQRHDNTWRVHKLNGRPLHPYTHPLRI